MRNTPKPFINIDKCIHLLYNVPPYALEPATPTAPPIIDA